MSTIAEAEKAVKFNVFYAKKMLWIASGKRQLLKVSISHTRKQK